MVEDDFNASDLISADDPIDLAEIPEQLKKVDVFYRRRARTRKERLRVIDIYALVAELKNAERNQ